MLCRTCLPIVSAVTICASQVAFSQPERVLKGIYPKTTTTFEKTMPGILQGIDIAKDVRYSLYNRSAELIHQTKWIPPVDGTQLFSIDGLFLDIDKIYNFIGSLFDVYRIDDKIFLSNGFYDRANRQAKFRTSKIQLDKTGKIRSISYEGKDQLLLKLGKSGAFPPLR